MAFPHLASFSTLDRCLSLICKAMAHPARIKMIKNLLAAKDHRLLLSGVAAGVQLSAASVSYHLAVLRDMEIIVSTNHGRSTMHELNKNSPTTNQIIRQYITTSIRAEDGAEKERLLSSLGRSAMHTNQEAVGLE